MCSIFEYACPSYRTLFTSCEVKATLISDYVERHNRGVRTGNFDSMLELFDARATMAFTGIPAGPFHGIAEIARAFHERPPDDELVVREIEQNTDGGEALYGWRSGNGTIEGRLRFLARDGRIVSLEVIRHDNPVD